MSDPEKDREEGFDGGDAADNSRHRPALPPGVVRSTGGSGGNAPRPGGARDPAGSSRGGAGRASDPPRSPFSLLKRKEAAAAGAVPGSITAIEPQQRREGRVNVYIDGAFALGVSEEVAAAPGLRVGLAMSAERLADLERAESLAKAKEAAYRLLSYRDRSEKEMRDRLARHGHAEEIVEEAMASLRANGYLDDARFAERWVANRGTTRGRRALAFELRQKGVDAAAAQEALSEAAGDESQRAAAREAAVRRVGERPADTSPPAKARLAAYLQRRGFDWDAIRPVLGELFDAAGEE